MDDLDAFPDGSGDSDLAGCDLAGFGRAERDGSLVAGSQAGDFEAADSERAGYGTVGCVRAGFETVEFVRLDSGSEIAP